MAFFTERQHALQIISELQKFFAIDADGLARESGMHPLATSHLLDEAVKNGTLERSGTWYSPDATWLEESK